MVGDNAHEVRRMTSEGQSPRDTDSGSPLHTRYPGADRPDQIPVDEATWSAVRNGLRVRTAAGEELGRVRDKSEHVFEVEVREGLLTTRELYVPHFAVVRVEGDTVYVAWSKQELADNYEHYRRYHFGRHIDD